MPVDFDKHVLAACMGTFARDVTIDPVKSSPGGMPYDARGIFTARSHDVFFDDGSSLSSRDCTLGIRAADLRGDETTMWLHLPVRGDVVTFKDTGAAMWVAETTEDGQGGVVLQLRGPTPP